MRAWRASDGRARALSAIAVVGKIVDHEDHPLAHLSCPHFGGWALATAFVGRAKEEHWRLRALLPRPERVLQSLFPTSLTPYQAPCPVPRRLSAPCSHCTLATSLRVARCPWRRLSPSPSLSKTSLASISHSGLRWAPGVTTCSPRAPTNLHNQGAVSLLPHGKGRWNGGISSTCTLQTLRRWCNSSKVKLVLASSLQTNSGLTFGLRLALQTCSSCVRGSQGRLDQLRGPGPRDWSHRLKC